MSESSSPIIAPNQSEANPKAGVCAYSRMGLGLFVLMACQLLLPYAVILAVSAVAPGLLQNQFFGMPLVYIAMYAIGFPLLLLVIRSVPSQPAWPKIPPRKKLSPLMVLALYPVSFAVLGVFSTTINFLELALGTSATVTTADVVSANANPWVPFIFGVIVAPIMEEIVFRGLPYNKVSAYGGGLYMAWTAILFGLFHMNFGQAIYAGALGLLFAYITYQTGSILYSIILHVLVNFTGGIGIGGLIMRWGSPLAYQIYSWYTLILMALGVVIGIVMLVVGRKKLKLFPAAQAFSHKARAFLNVGTILFCLVCLAIIAMGFLS